MQLDRSLLQLLVVSVTALGIVICVGASTTYAFSVGPLPGLNCGGLLPPVPCDLAPALSQYEEVHQIITFDALIQVRFTPPSGTTALRFSPQALRDIRDGNVQIDYIQGDHELHFDNAYLYAGGERLIKGKEDLLTQLRQLSTLTTTQVTILRTKFGGYLHTLQDFYAHSNYVNLTIPPPIELGDVRPPTQPQFTIPCFPTPGVLSQEGQRDLLTTGHAISPLHLGIAPSGQCAHGLLDGGIHKDWNGRNHHAEARSHAIAASIQFVNSIINHSSNNPENVCMFMTGEPCQKEAQCTDPSPTISGRIEVLSRVNGSLRGNFGLEDFSGATISKGFSEGGASATVTGQKGSLSLTAQGRSGGEISSSHAKIEVNYDETLLVEAPGNTGSGVVAFTPSIGKGADASCSGENAFSSGAYDFGVGVSFYQQGNKICNFTYPERDIGTIDIPFTYGSPFTIRVRLDVAASSSIPDGLPQSGSGSANIGVSYGSSNFVVKSPPPNVTVKFCRSQQ